MARTCAWCRRDLAATVRADARFCSRRCRQTACRLRRRRATAVVNRGPLRFAYADPPYPGTARRYYSSEPSYAGEVDHAELVASLEASGYAGWALSTSARALRDLLPLCPPHARVCAWVKPIGVSGLTYGLHNAWEALIVVGGRQRRPGRRDWLRAHPARGGGTLPGRKPIAFCAWLFDCLGMLAGDELVDLFPGTGIVSRAWAELSLLQERDASPRSSTTAVADAGVGDSCHSGSQRQLLSAALSDPSPPAPDDMSPSSPGDSCRCSSNETAPIRSTG
jgi:hypothetical protein